MKKNIMMHERNITMKVFTDWNLCTIYFGRKSKLNGHKILYTLSCIVLHGRDDLMAKRPLMAQQYLMAN